MKLMQRTFVSIRGMNERIYRGCHTDRPIHTGWLSLGPSDTLSSQQATERKILSPAKRDTSRKAYNKEFRKVIEHP
jgi:hypothetical protein